MKAMTELKNEIADISIQMAEKIIKSKEKRMAEKKKKEFWQNLLTDRMTILLPRLSPY